MAQSDSMESVPLVYCWRELSGHQHSGNQVGKKYQRCLNIEYGNFHQFCFLHGSLVFNWTRRPRPRDPSVPLSQGENPWLLAELGRGSPQLHRVEERVWGSMSSGAVLCLRLHFQRSLVPSLLVLGRVWWCKPCSFLTFSGLGFSSLGSAKSVGTRPVFQPLNFCHYSLSCFLCPSETLKKIPLWTS